MNPVQTEGPLNPEDQHVATEQKNSKIFQEYRTILGFE